VFGSSGIIPKLTFCFRRTKPSTLALRQGAGGGTTSSSQTRSRSRLKPGTTLPGNDAATGWCTCSRCISRVRTRLRSRTLLRSRTERGRDERSRRGWVWEGRGGRCWAPSTSTPYTSHPAPSTLQPTPCTLHPTPYTLHPKPYTLHLTPCTLQQVLQVHAGAV